MINFIKTYLAERTQQQADAESHALKEEMLAEAEVIAENTELRTICINNVMYIESYINVLSANVNHAKGTNAASTNRKRKSIRERIQWLKSKLPEEIGMIEYYNDLI
jgi:hypothetical protein